MSPESEVRNALLDAKAILLHGKYHVGRGHLSRTDKLLAIHHAHQAVELTLREKRRNSVQTRTTFPRSSACSRAIKYPYRMKES